MQDTSIHKQLYDIDGLNSCLTELVHTIVIK